MEALPQAPEGDEGLRREAPGGHLAVGPLERAGGAHAVEAADKQVHTGAPVLAHAVGAAAGARVHLAVLAWGDGAGERGSHGSLVGGGGGEGEGRGTPPVLNPQLSPALFQEPHLERLRMLRGPRALPTPTSARRLGILGLVRAPPVPHLPRRPTAPLTMLGSDPVIKSVLHTGPQLCSNGLPAKTAPPQPRLPPWQGSSGSFH